MSHHIEKGNTYFSQYNITELHIFIFVLVFARSARLSFLAFVRAQLSSPARIPSPLPSGQPPHNESRTGFICHPCAPRTSDWLTAQGAAQALTSHRRLRLRCVVQLPRPRHGRSCAHLRRGVLIVLRRLRPRRCCR